MVRGLAIRQSMDRACVPADLDLVVPAMAYSHLGGERTHTFALETDLWKDPATADRSELARLLRSLAPDLLIVDLFWVPIANMTLTMPTWLLLRSIPPAWLVGPPQAPFQADRHERILAMEPAPLLERFEQLGPVVYTDPDLASRARRDELAAVLGVPADRPLRLVMRAGEAVDDALLQQRAAALGGSWSRMELGSASSVFPLSHWLAALQPGDEVVSGMGFNSFWEAALLGYGAHMHWVPMPRRIDDQQWRGSLVADAPVRATQNGADRLAELVRVRLGPA